MRKISNYTLFFTLIIVLSSFAADNVIQQPDSPPVTQAASSPLISVTTIKASTSSMKGVMKILEENDINLKEAAIYFDFDETAAFTKGTCKDITFRLLPCPDRIRTYRAAFAKAFENTDFNLDFFNICFLSDRDSRTLPVIEEYEVLDPDVIELIRIFKEKAAFVNFCSSLPGTEKKYKFIEDLGLEREKYVFAGGSKSRAIYQHLKEQPQPRSTISTIVLIDNSEESVIKPFLARLPELVDGLDFGNVKIIGIEFTKFAEMATVEAIREELTILQTLQRQ